MVSLFCRYIYFFFIYIYIIVYLLFVRSPIGPQVGSFQMSAFSQAALAYHRDVNASWT